MLQTKPRHLEIMKFDGIPQLAHMITHNTEVYAVFNNFDTITWISKGSLRIYNRTESIALEEGAIFFTSKFADCEAQRSLDPFTQEYEAVVLVLLDLPASSEPHTPNVKPKLNFQLHSSKLEQVFRNFHQQFYQETKSTSEAFNKQLKTIQSELLQQASKELKALEKHRNNKLLNFVSQHITSNLTLDELALQYGVSKSTFQRICKKAFGIPAQQWIKNHKLHQARFQMQYTQKPVSQIYLECGYEDLAHFSKDFKKKFGYNPSDTYGTVTVRIHD